MPGTWCAHGGRWQGAGQRPGVGLRTGWPPAPAQLAEGWPGGRGGANLAMPALATAAIFSATNCAALPGEVLQGKPLCAHFRQRAQQPDKVQTGVGRGWQTDKSM